MNPEGSTLDLMDWPEVGPKVKKSRSQIDRDEARGLFPTRVKLGPHKVAWYRSEIERHLSTLPRAKLKGT